MQDAAIVYSTEMKKDGAIMFGGCHHGNVHDLVGTTRYLFHLLGHSDVDDRQLLKGSICCGGGPVSIQEYQEFFKMGYPCYYLPVEARYRVIDPDLEWGNSVFNKYGIVHQVRMGLCFINSCCCCSQSTVVTLVGLRRWVARKGMGRSRQISKMRVGFGGQIYSISS